jgi:hypothetical protein
MRRMPLYKYISIYLYKGKPLAHRGGLMVDSAINSAVDC